MFKHLFSIAACATVISCSAISPKGKTTASEDQASVDNPTDNSGSSGATKVYNCTTKRGNVEILCSRYPISDDLVEQLEKSCENSGQSDGFASTWTQSDCSEETKKYNKCEIPSGTAGFSTVIFGGYKEDCAQATFTSGTQSSTSPKNNTGATPGSADSLACIADLITKVTGTWQPLTPSEDSYVEMRS